MRSSFFAIPLGIVTLAGATGAFAQTTTLTTSIDTEISTAILPQLQKVGIQNGPLSFSLSIGADNFSLSGNTIQDFTSKFIAAYGTKNPIQQIIIKSFPDLQHVPPIGTAGSPLNTEAISATLMFDGITIRFSTPQNSTALTLDVTGSTINKTFTGATRQASEQQALAYLTSGRVVLLNQLENAVRGQSVSSAISGNPNSLVGTLAQNNFFSGSSAGESEPGSSNASLGDVFALSAQTQLFHSDGTHGTVLTIPLQYTYFFEDPRYAATIDFPFTYIDQDKNGQSYSGSLGINMRVPVLENWYLKPGFRIGAVGQTYNQPNVYDSGAALYSFSLTSKYNVFYDDWKISLNDSVGYYEALDLRIGKAMIAPNVSNVVYKNGLSAELPTPLQLFDTPTSFAANFTDTHVAGTLSQISQWDEVSVDFGTRQTAGTGSLDSFRIGFGYLWGDRDYKAFELTVSAQF